MRTNKYIYSVVLVYAGHGFNNQDEINSFETGSNFILSKEDKNELKANIKDVRLSGYGCKTIRRKELNNINLN